MITEIFASRVFNDDVMRQRLPRSAYESIQKTKRLGVPLDPSTAEIAAGAMKDWAISQGATHYTHWFQPMTNITAGKHDSFLSLTNDGRVMMEFSGKALVQGEPDASSFPSGGLRETFEARGYTMWDPTSPAFVRDGTLYIPTAFCSYTGEALDTKTPLLRSMDAVSKASLAVLRLFGNNSAQRVNAMVGAEQEYFLVDRALYEQRLDLKICGRTLFGAKPPKGQQLDDHYCGRIRLRVADFMRDLDEQLWALGITAKTKHNEAAPAQHELAPIFCSANIACDHNQLTMEMMRITAKKHGLACLLHEKPFAEVNGSGKHNNWSLSTDDGVNLLEPGKTPWENLQFLTFLCAVITAVEEYGDLLRLAAASPGNDCRLGGFEAPPAIISIFLGEALTGILQSLATGDHMEHPARTILQMGVESLPKLPRDDSDRNRTSPFAFTGNKFEFRMVGSSQSIAYANVMLNAAVADVLCRFAKRLEKAQDFDQEILALVRETVEQHGRILFNGNNYSREWRDEAARRGLPVLNSSIEAIDCLTAEKNVELFRRQGIFSSAECASRREIMLENYSKVIAIEAATMLEMVKRQIYPAVAKFAGQTAGQLRNLQETGLAPSSLVARTAQLSQHLDAIDGAAAKLEQVLAQATSLSDYHEQAVAIRDQVLPAMALLRESCDQAETITGADCWPVPTYTDLLHRV